MYLDSTLRFKLLMTVRSLYFPTLYTECPTKSAGILKDLYNHVLSSEQHCAFLFYVRSNSLSFILEEFNFLRVTSSSVTSFHCWRVQMYFSSKHSDATTETMYCITWLIESNSVITVLHDVCLVFGDNKPSDNIIRRWLSI